ncbi:MAG: hybrid sensor histidine kinase/response regulator, partial [Pseudomonas sp.]|nr:hybrid sensor histidine kinase/response regulator [Pseudomonas sp.]
STALQLHRQFIDVQVQIDQTRLEQILVNLIGNALKFTELGSVQVEATWQPIDHETIWLTCTVRDSGIGISAERLELMFNAFQQADSSISRRYGGTGLGLPIARTLAERMGGTLRAQSEEGMGSVFTLEIPLTLYRLRNPEKPSTHHTADNDGKNQQVLLVEDNPVNQTVIEAMLRSLGFQISTVGDGAQAVSAASTGDFAAILMDCRLPVIDGYEATRQIRQLPGLTEVPIIALTANALHGDREACLQAGMNDYLAKPFKRADLQRVLQRWVPFQASATGDKC